MCIYSIIGCPDSSLLESVKSDITEVSEKVSSCSNYDIKVGVTTFLHLFCHKCCCRASGQVLQKISCDVISSSLALLSSSEPSSGSCDHSQNPAGSDRCFSQRFPAAVYHQQVSQVHRAPCQVCRLFRDSGVKLKETQRLRFVFYAF